MRQSKELAVRDRPGGPERTIYRAPEMFYWLGWSPDGRFVALWEIEQYSGSVDQDGRPLEDLAGQIRGAAKRTVPRLVRVGGR